MTASLFSGWSFPETCLHPIVDALPADTPDCSIAWSLGGLQLLSLPIAPRPWPLPSSPSPIAPCPLILLSSTARFCGDETGWPGLPTAHLRALKKLFRRDPALALRQFHRLCAGPSLPEADLLQRAQSSLDLGLSTLDYGLHLLETLDARTSAPGFPAPVLVLHGAHDQVIPLAAAEATAQLLPRAQLIVHPDLGHDLPLQAPAWVAAHIREFLGNPP